jgi:subfamily B ATP-binding cassette protein MsbA
MIIVSVAFAAITAVMLNPEVLGKMTTGSFITFLVASGMLVKPIRQLTEINSAIQKGIAASQSIFEVLDADVEINEGIVELKSVNGDFNFKDISFSYHGMEKNVLEGINFQVEPGQTIALVGSSGSGKSTLINLIPRFYNLKKGSISLDGKNIKEFTLDSLRKKIALVSQRVTLFNGSVYNNIAYGELKNKSMEEVVAAAQMANADEFIKNLPAGYDTIIGDDGVMLSGGQRQRIAIARAILKDAPILILDEATSALDSDSERAIQLALDSLIKDRTTFVIAHRLSTIEKADQILVMESGKIVEKGSHKELLAKSGRYSQLYNKEFEVDNDTSTHLENK